MRINTVRTADIPPCTIVATWTIYTMVTFTTHTKVMSTST
jgi:hypothetical protein